MKRLFHMFRMDDLKKVGNAYPWSNPPGIGDHVQLNLGGPDMIVVDLLDPETVMCAWPGNESPFRWKCLKPSR